MIWHPQTAGWVGVGEENPYACMYSYMYTHTLNMINMLPTINHFLTCIFSMYVHACWGTSTHTYTQPSWRSQMSKNWITLELILIIWFCVKIFDLWTLLHSYRLGCAGGVSHPKWHINVSGPQKYMWLLMSGPGKNFPVFTLDPIRTLGPLKHARKAWN